jgi:hypothetical protein
MVACFGNGMAGTAKADCMWGIESGDSLANSLAQLQCSTKNAKYKSNQKVLQENRFEITAERSQEAGNMRNQIDRHYLL